MSSIESFVETARKKGLKDIEIKERLLDAGWDAVAVYTAIEKDPELIPPAAPQSSRSSAPTHLGSGTINVVNSGYSAVGFEYLIYFVSVGIVALAFGGLLHNLVAEFLSSSDNYAWYSDVIPVAVSALIVALPIMLFLMVRLNKKELAKPEVVNDPSRRRAVQLLMLITFVVGVIKLISYLYSILTPSTGGYDDVSVLEETIHALITIGIAGGVFVNYWRKQSKLN